MAKQHSSETGNIFNFFDATLNTLQASLTLAVIPALPLCLL